MEADQDMLATQQRRLEKQRATENPTPLKSFEEIGDRCLQIARERAEIAKLFPDPPEPVIYRFTVDQVLLPARYRNCSFESFQGNDKLIERVWDAMDRNESLVLIGNTGCGKTHLAIAALRHGVDTGKIGPGVVFAPVPELLLKIRSCFRDDARETEEEIIDRYSHCPFLILDDLGAEKTSEFSIATLELIIDRRVRENRQTIITTNLSLEEIEGKLSARIASRFAEMNCIKITMPDYRKRRKDA